MALHGRVSAWWVVRGHGGSSSCNHAPQYQCRSPSGVSSCASSGSKAIGIMAMTASSPSCASPVIIARWRHFCQHKHEASFGGKRRAVVAVGAAAGLVDGEAVRKAVGAWRVWPRSFLHRTRAAAPGAGQLLQRHRTIVWPGASAIPLNAPAAPRHRRFVAPTAAPRLLAPLPRYPSNSRASMLKAWRQRRSAPRGARAR